MVKKTLGVREYILMARKIYMYVFLYNNFFKERLNYTAVMQVNSIHNKKAVTKKM